MSLSIASVFAALLAIEIFLRLTGIDQRLVLRSLFFQGADLEVHRVSDDPFLHYELKPGAQLDGHFPGKPPYHVSIDEHGARAPAHAGPKALGTFRILAFGGSTLYGAAVNDDDTPAAALERRLNAEAAAHRIGDRRYEVWNFGTSAYTLGQAAHLARTKLSQLDPDLILVQHHNLGRRGFLMPENNRPETYPFALLTADPEFYDEQFGVPSFVPLALHRIAMRYSALYRWIIISFPPLTVSLSCEYCDRLSADEARSLSGEAAAAHVPVIYFTIPADQGGWGPDAIYPGLPAEQFIDLYRPNRDADFYEVHPPAATLDEFAALLVPELEARHLVPARN